jgi:hypothetical protein
MVRAGRVNLKQTTKSEPWMCVYDAHQGVLHKNLGKTPTRVPEKSRVHRYCTVLYAHRTLQGWFSLCSVLKQHTLLIQEDITYIAATNKTDTTGRWDIIVMEYCQEKLQTWLQANLERLLKECPTESAHDRPEDFPSPGIQSQNA